MQKAKRKKLYIYNAIAGFNPSDTHPFQPESPSYFPSNGKIKKEVIK